MSFISSMRSNMFRSLILVLLFLARTNHGFRNDSNGIRPMDVGVVRSFAQDTAVKPGEDRRQQQRLRRKQRRGLDHGRERRRERHGKSQYYEFLDGDASSKPSSLSDIWLCMACALGWCVWLVSARQPPQGLENFEEQESAKVMGHVLQVSLGEDLLGTGIPVYYALVDYVVAGETDAEHIQVRKVFTSKKLLEEGFANVEVLYLTEDPTTAILLEDLLDHRKQRESQPPPSTAYYALIYFVSVVLIATSVLGGARMASRLEQPLWGWISLAVGIILLYPAAKVLYRFVTYLYSLAGPLTERPGVIMHGKRLYWAQQCHGTLNPIELMGCGGDDHSTTERRKQHHPQEASVRSIELSDLSIPQIGDTRRRHNDSKTTRPKLFPNAGCGFGNFNVHLPTRRDPSGSSVSSISISGSHHSEKSGRLVRNDTSILEKYEKYEQHVSATTEEKKQSRHTNTSELPTITTSTTSYC